MRELLKKLKMVLIICCFVLVPVNCAWAWNHGNSFGDEQEQDQNQKQNQNQLQFQDQEQFQKAVAEAVGIALAQQSQANQQAFNSNYRAISYPDLPADVGTDNLTASGLGFNAGVSKTRDYKSLESYYGFVQASLQLDLLSIEDAKEDINDIRQKYRKTTKRKKVIGLFGEGVCDNVILGNIPLMCM